MTWSGLYSSTLALHWCVLRSFFFMTHSYLKQYCNFLFSLLFFACLLSRTRSPMLDQCSTWELSQVLFTQTYYSTHHSTFQINAHNCLTTEVWCPAFVARNCQKYAAFLKLGETRRNGDYYTVAKKAQQIILNLSTYHPIWRTVYFVYLV